jgi:hypothetical protein
MTDKTTKMLPCHLDDDAVQERGRLLAVCVQEISDLEEEKKAKVKEYADQIKAKEERKAELAESVVTRTERRPVPISEVQDNRLFKIDTIRHDTMAIIDSRAMTADEAEQARQPALFDDRATAQSRDDRPPADQSLSSADTQAAPAPATAPTGPCDKCGEANGVHLDNCPEVNPAMPAPPAPADTEITAPAALLEGKPDGNA